jgi:hypothetical protein
MISWGFIVGFLNRICGRPLGRFAAVVARMVIKLPLEPDLMPSQRDAEPTVAALS